MKFDTQSPASSRDVAKRSKRARRAHVMCSPKNGFVEIRLESRLEQSVAQALELDPRVRAYRAQPFTLDLTSGERLAAKSPHKPPGAVYYTPDFIVDLDDLQVVVEVKPSAFVEKHRALLAEVRGALLKQGLRFCVITEADFQGHYLRNAQLFLQYLAQAAPALPKWAAALQVRDPHALTGPVSQVLAGDVPLNHQLAAGVLLGLVQFDLVRHPFEHMDFDIAPAFGSLSAFEVIRYEQ
ncbi:Tn7 transposase TnsA N-terminal domain-containing protein [Pseudomonas putida]|uniref:Tn7 transposase TnsA N-terminal domain-containing protein n=1 Tax=Pseudomonas putida TaxID=303 RepID=UPI001E30CAA1|nr:Tn7 transposase TnsA N-terminal domain-containing protein [Pseudomonas putida]